MVANNTFGSRLLYAFSRDRMVPGSDTFTKLSHNRRLPYNAILTTAGMAIVVLLLNLGVQKVYATLISVGVLAWYISYAFPIFSQVVVHHKKRYRPGRFNLGRASYIVTLLASLWIVIEIINVSWPRDASLPWYQNWGVILVAVGLGVVGVGAYFIAPRHEGHLGNAPLLRDGNDGAATSGAAGTAAEEV